MQVALPVVVSDLGELHGQRGSSLRGPLVLEHLCEGAAHAYPVHAAVVVKAVVLTQNQGVDENGGDFPEGHPLAVFPVQGADGPVLAVQNHRAFRNVALDLGNVIAVGNGSVKEHQDGTDYNADEAAPQQDAQGPADEPADIPRQGADEAERHQQDKQQGAENREARLARPSCSCGTGFSFRFRVVLILLLRSRTGSAPRARGRCVMPGRTAAGISCSAGGAGNDCRTGIFLRQPGIGRTGRRPFFAFRLGTGSRLTVLDAFPPGAGISFP